MSEERSSGSFSFAEERTACLDVRAVVEAWLTIGPPPPPLTPERARAAAQLLLEAGLAPVPLATPRRDPRAPSAADPAVPRALR